jgi:hypothetical protein
LHSKVSNFYYLKPKSNELIIFDSNKKVKKVWLNMENDVSQGFTILCSDNNDLFILGDDGLSIYKFNK